MGITILIVDDEENAIANLGKLIATYCPSLSIVDTARSVSDAATKINKLKPDAVFLDINMPKQNGFELLDRIEHFPAIVFVTAHEKYALAALKVCAVDFLLKPIKINELIQTQEKLLQIQQLKPHLLSAFPQVLRNLRSILDKPGSVRKITLKDNNGHEIFNMDDILYLGAEAGYTTFFFVHRKPLLITKTIVEYEEMLEPYGFLRVHKSTIVNLMHIKQILRNENPAVILNDGTTLNVSRRRLPELIEWSNKK